MPMLNRAGPALSVVIPTYNRRPLLRQVLAGLSQQTFPAWQFEVIVVVDGATDGTGAMLEALSTPFDLRVLYRDRSGPAGTRNAGLAAARGQAVVFLDDDVIPHPELIAAHASVHRYDERAVVIGRVTPCCAVPRPGWEDWEDYIARRDYELLERNEACLGGGLFYTWNVSASRDCLNQAGGFDPTLAFQEDIDLGFRLEEAGVHFHFRPDAAGQHCGHRPTYSAWCRRHYRFGFHRALLQQRRTTRHLHSLRASIDSYHPLTRVFLWLTLGRTIVGQTAEGTFRATAAAFDALRVRPVSRVFYSLIAIHHYWRGVLDSVGDATLLRQKLFRASDPPPIASAGAPTT